MLDITFMARPVMMMVAVVVIPGPNTKYSRLLLLLLLLVLHKRDNGSSAQPSPTSDAFLEGTQALNRQDCLCRLGFDSHDASEQMTLLWPTRIPHAGLDRAQTGDNGFASVSHFMRDHRSQVVQNHFDCFLPQLRLCGDSMHEARLGQDRTC